MKKRNQIWILFLIMLCSITACSMKEENTDIAATRMTQLKDSKKVNKDMERSQSLQAFLEVTKKKEMEIPEVASYMKNALKQSTPEEVSYMLLYFEELQLQQKLPQEELLYPAKIQAGLRDLDATGIDYNRTDFVTDPRLARLIEHTRACGYQIVEEKGKYVPIIDYGFYKQYSGYATPEIKEYVKLMAVESDTPYSIDDTLTISWSELINRAILFEQFLREYPNSERLDAVGRLYREYIYLAMYGLPGTPLFDPRTKEMVDDARYSYEKAIGSNLESDFLEILKEYLGTVTQNEFKWNEKVAEVCEKYCSQLELEQDEADRYTAAGIEDAAEFEKVYRMLQNAMKSWDQELVAEYVVYPVTVTIEGQQTQIANEEIFLEHYGQIINDKVKTAFLTQDITQAGIDQYGVRIGDGRVWLKCIPGTRHKYSIGKINNQ